jgi:hypothetical protein
MRRTESPPLRVFSLAIALAACLTFLPARTAHGARPRRGQAELFVESGGAWWAAQEVRRTNRGTLVHYVDWARQWDETVDAGRIKHRSADGGQPFVEWGGRWWPATILATRPDGRMRVHYDGWGKEWDETVAPSRLIRLA